MTTDKDVEKSDPVPAIWEDYDWALAYRLLAKAATQSGLGSESPRHLKTRINTGFALNRALTRQSLAASDQRVTSPQTYQHIVTALFECLQDHSQLFIAIYSKNVEGWADDWYVLANAPRTLMRMFCPSATSPASFIQGQSWGNGDGLAILVGIDWEYANDRFGDATEQGYVHTLVDCGRVGQSILLVGQELGLSARMTPAVSETTISEALALKPEQEPLYFLRLGYSRLHPFERTP